MASEKKAVLFISPVTKQELEKCTSTNVQKLLNKGSLLKNLTENNQAYAVQGSKTGETIWQAAVKEGLVVDSADKAFDMCVYENMSSLASLETELEKLFDTAPRSTLYVLIGKDFVLFYGLGIDKGKVIDTAYCPCVVASTIAYIVDFPLPDQCVAPICYEVLKDKNYKFKEIQKLQTTIQNLEAAIERGGRRPWDKHDCA